MAVTVAAKNGKGLMEHLMTIDQLPISIPIEQDIVVLWEAFG
jgi:hypothetical protein